MRQIEIFSAGCAACDETIALVNSLVCASCSVQILDMKDGAVATRAKALGVQRVPAVVVDGQLVSCCEGSGVNASALRAAGVGRA